jgi:hypothetical protein
MANVKPGDRAVVIGGVAPSNIGKIVLVIEEAHDGDPMRGGIVGLLRKDPNALGWWVESLGSPFNYYSGEGGSGCLLGQSPIAPIADRGLRRLVDPSEVLRFNRADKLSTRKNDHAEA